MTILETVNKIIRTIKTPAKFNETVHETIYKIYEKDDVKAEKLRREFYNLWKLVENGCQDEDDKVCNGLGHIMTEILNKTDEFEKSLNKESENAEIPKEADINLTTSKQLEKLKNNLDTWYNEMSEINELFVQLLNETSEKIQPDDLRDLADADKTEFKMKSQGFVEDFKTQHEKQVKKGIEIHLKKILKADYNYVIQKDKLIDDCFDQNLLYDEDGLRKIIVATKRFQSKCSEWEKQLNEANHRAFNFTMKFVKYVCYEQNLNIDQLEDIIKNKDVHVIKYSVGKDSDIKIIFGKMIKDFLNEKYPTNKEQNQVLRGNILEKLVVNGADLYKPDSIKNQISQIEHSIAIDDVEEMLTKWLPENSFGKKFIEFLKNTNKTTEDIKHVNSLDRPNFFSLNNVFFEDFLKKRRVAFNLAVFELMLESKIATNEIIEKLKKRRYGENFHPEMLQSPEILKEKLVKICEGKVNQTVNATAEYLIENECIRMEICKENLFFNDSELAEKIEPYIVDYKKSTENTFERNIQDEVDNAIYAIISDYMKPKFANQDGLTSDCFADYLRREKGKEIDAIYKPELLFDLKNEEKSDNKKAIEKEDKLLNQKLDEYKEKLGVQNVPTSNQKHTGNSNNRNGGTSNKNHGYRGYG